MIVVADEMKPVFVRTESLEVSKISFDSTALIAASCNEWLPVVDRRY